MSYKKNFAEYYGQEIFVLGKEESSSDEVFIFENYEELLDKLKELNPDSDLDFIIIHGIMAPAHTLPSSILDSKAYIIALNPDGALGEGSIVEISDDATIDDMAEEIENVVSRGMNVDHLTDIEYTYLVYGYPLNLCLSINEDEMDEIAIKTSTRVVEEVKLIADANGQGFRSKFNLEREREKGAI